MFRTLCAVASLAVATPIAAQGPVVVARVARAVDSILTAAASRGFAGVGLIMKDGAPILRKGYGLAQRETRTPDGMYDNIDLALERARGVPGVVEESAPAA